MIAPIPIALPGTPEWLEARRSGIFASEAAAACGMSEDRQPLDVYLEKIGAKPPFGGNEYTKRGKRFEPFLAQEYCEQTGFRLRYNLPAYLSGEHKFIGATPDAVHEDDPTYGTELKLCDRRRAKELGDEHTDQIFTDWLFQVQQQMYVMGWRVCDVFVMLDLHTYKHYTVERDEQLIGEIVAAEMELWDRIERQQPPELDWECDNARELISYMFGCSDPEPIDLDEETARMWLETCRLKNQIKTAEQQVQSLKAKIQHKMQGHAVGRLPGHQKELVQTTVKDSIVTEDDVRALSNRVGKIKRHGFTKLSERRVRA